MNKYIVATFEDEDDTTFILIDRQTNQSVYWTSASSSKDAYQDICKMRDDFNRGGR